jgi:hypothetical protein
MTVEMAQVLHEIDSRMGEYLGMKIKQTIKVFKLPMKKQSIAMVRRKQ